MSKIKINPAVLAAAAKVSSVAVASSAPDITSHHLFRVRDGKLELLSSTRSVFMSVNVDGAEFEGGPPEAFSFEARRLSALLESLGGKTTISFEVAPGGSVTVETPRGRNTFQGLDPSTFPYWDDELAEATGSAVAIEVARLRQVLADARPYIYDDEAKGRQYCVAEFRNGLALATDQKSFFRTWLAGDPALTFRINGRDVGAVVAALSHAKGDNVNVLCHPKVTFFQADNLTLGEMLVDVKFPEPKTMPGVREGELPEGAERWKFFVEEYREVAGLLASAARFDDYRLSFRRKGNTLFLSMKTVGGKRTEIALPLHDAAYAPDSAFPPPKEGDAAPSFVLSKDYFDNLIKGGGNTFQMDVLAKGASGRASARTVSAKGDVTLIDLPWVRPDAA